MPKIGEMKESKFLGKQDVGEGILLTITGCQKFDLAKEGAPPIEKWCLMFRETEKPLVLNVTNARIAEQALGSDDTDHWIGKKIVAYTDHSIMYEGKLLGGVRLRKSKKPQPITAPPPVMREPGEDDEMGF
jgi:hypothetical protein